MRGKRKTLVVIAQYRDAWDDRKREKIKMTGSVRASQHATCN